MSDVKHTPGPWLVNDKYVKSEECLYIESSGDGVATVFIGISGTERANARLIAAAPELLAACRELLPEGWGDGSMDHFPGVRKARLAIAKAEGSALEQTA